jgi:hypothetical protein
VSLVAAGAAAWSYRRHRTAVEPDKPEAPDVIELRAPEEDFEEISA